MPLRKSEIKLTENRINQKQKITKKTNTNDMYNVEKMKLQCGWKIREGKRNLQSD